MKKKIIWVLLLALIAYASFVTVDCIRLRYGAEKPLITVGEEITDTRVTYYGPGYSISNYVNIGEIWTEDGITYVEQLGYGAEFRLFNKILIWAWIE